MNKNVENLGKSKDSSFLKEIISFTKTLIIIVIIVVSFRYFIAEFFIVDGVSMSPNFETGHYLVINKLSGVFTDVERGDILVFVPPSERDSSWLKYTVFFDPRAKYIKRVIGLPGETIKLYNNKIFLKKEGGDEFVELYEPYLKNNIIRTESKTILGNNEYFMLGDNRASSYDSEEWGPIKKSDIIGSPVLRMLPFNHFGTNPADHSF